MIMHNEGFRRSMKVTIFVALSGHQKMEPTRQRPLLKGILGARMKNKWEEQLVDTPIDYITSVNTMYAPVLN